MKLDSYWKEGLAPAHWDTSALPEAVDVAVIGAGFCGLSAALELARNGLRVAILEAHDSVTAEASGRNGGHVNNGLAVDYATLAEKLGTEQARAIYHVYDDAVDTVERLVRQEQIDCDFLRHGKLKLASRPAHFEALARSFKRLADDRVDTDMALLDQATVRAEVDSDIYHGGLLYKKSGQMHMGRFGRGLAEAAVRHGATLHLATPVEKLTRIGGSAHGYRVHTPRGVIGADRVLLATGASRHGGYGSFGWIRRRIVPIGSFIVATAPLGEARATALLRERRTYVTTSNLHHYFRISPDHRLIFGGRARFAISNPLSDAESGKILQAGLLETFPQLQDVPLTHCWGGIVDMTRDRLPHAGVRHGLYYAMGFSGHGTQMSVHTGQRIARVMLGETEANPWRYRNWPAIPGHLGPPWFLPLMGMYYRMKDALA
ncbi:FAD-dependent oxidoreductase [Robbsia andropogonis]|uniref:FAD-dependent oxidoreductase n=1 Tax=Robbsia andropogonis TaxID=28092 RepID=A0A0F5K0S1_9BURK|nr:FAD-binding oxidoreductase [Robbsia andropogonis]KKB63688.1 FAD-dependent oxidoreductase [Robbsia andropogonis]